MRQPFICRPSADIDNAFAVDGGLAGSHPIQCNGDAGEFCKQVIERSKRHRRDNVIADHRNAPVNALGYLRVMFTVDDIDDTLARLQKIGAQLVGEVVKYEELYRLCYIRGPEGILIGLAEQLSKNRDPL